MIFNIEGIKVELTENQYGLRLNALEDEYPLPGQTLEETREMVTKNFGTVKEKFGKASSNAIPDAELHEVCLGIVLYYFYLYNSWKRQYEKEKDRDLGFLETDFKHPYTYDRVIQYFKRRYPNDYAVKCAALLELTAEQVLAYEAQRRDFYDAFR